MAKSLRAMHWKERLHPRDNRGRFAEKGGSKWLTRVADEMGAAFGDVSMGPRPGEVPRGRLQTGKGGLIDVGALSRAAPRTAVPKGTFERGTASATSSNAGVRPSAASLKKGDHARVQGEDIYGRKITMNGYVDTPTPVRVGKGKSKRSMLSISVSEQPDGGGTRSRVLVAPDATVEHTTPSADMKRLEGRAPGGRKVEPAAVRGAGAFSTDPAIRAAAQRHVDDTQASIKEAEEKARKGRTPGATVDRPPARPETGGVTQTPKQAAALAAGRTRAKELRAEDLRDSIDPKQNGAKIAAIEAGTLDYADLYRTKIAGPRGQRAQSPVARVRHTPDNPSGEFRITDPSSGTLLGWASRTVHDGQQTYVFHSEDYDGAQKLEGWSDSLATGADVLRIGEHAATRGGSNYHAAISQGGFKRHVPLSPLEADRAELLKERKALENQNLGPEIRAAHERRIAQLERDIAEATREVEGPRPRNLLAMNRDSGVENPRSPAAQTVFNDANRLAKEGDIEGAKKKLQQGIRDFGEDTQDGQAFRNTLDVLDGKSPTHKPYAGPFGETLRGMAKLGDEIDTFKETLGQRAATTTASDDELAISKQLHELHYKTPDFERAKAIREGARAEAERETEIQLGRFTIGGSTHASKLSQAMGEHALAQDRLKERKADLEEARRLHAQIADPTLAERAMTESVKPIEREVEAFQANVYKAEADIQKAREGIADEVRRGGKRLQGSLDREAADAAHRIAVSGGYGLHGDAEDERDRLRAHASYIGKALQTAMKDVEVSRVPAADRERIRTESIQHTTLMRETLAARERRDLALSRLDALNTPDVQRRAARDERFKAKLDEAIATERTGLAAAEADLNRLEPGFEGAVEALQEQVAEVRSAQGLRAVKLNVKAIDKGYAARLKAKGITEHERHEPPAERSTAEQAHALANKLKRSGDDTNAARMREAAAALERGDTTGALLKARLVASNRNAHQDEAKAFYESIKPSGDDFAAEARAAVAKVDPRKDWSLSKEAPAGAKIPLTSGGKPKVPRSGSPESTSKYSTGDYVGPGQAYADRADLVGQTVSFNAPVPGNRAGKRQDVTGVVAGVESINGGTVTRITIEGRAKPLLLDSGLTVQAPRGDGRRSGGAGDAAAALAAATSRDEARAALAGLTVAELRGVAAGMRDGQGITVRDGKDNIINDIVEAAVGRRLDSEAIGRQGAGRRPGGIVTGPNARQQAAIELGTSFSGNPYMKLPKLEALTDEDFRGLTPDQQDNVRFLIHKLTQRAPGEDQRRAEALRARFGAWSSGKA